MSRYIMLSETEGTSGHIWMVPSAICANIELYQEKDGITCILALTKAEQPINRIHQEEFTWTYEKYPITMLEDEARKRVMHVVASVITRDMTDLITCAIKDEREAYTDFLRALKGYSVNWGNCYSDLMYQYGRAEEEDNEKQDKV